METQRNIDCCGNIEVDTIEMKMNAFFTRAASIYSNLTTKAISQEAYGTVGCAYNNVNDVNYLGFYCYLILKDEEEYYQINGVHRTWEELAIEYQILCIIDTFQRKGIDIKPLLEPFGLWPNTTSKDGIGYMGISSITSPINRVK